MGQVAAGRVAGLCDGGGYRELFGHPGSVYLCARGELAGRPLLVIATDPEPTAEPPDLPASLRRVLRTLALAGERGWPLAFLFDAPALYQSRKTAFQGADLGLLMGREGVGRLYYELGRLGRKVPVVGGVFGAMAQAQAFPVAMCRALVMLADAAVSIARPDAVKAMLGEDADYRELGGARVHSRRTGMCDFVAADQGQALAWLRRLLGLLPASRGGRPPEAPAAGVDPAAGPLAEILPERLNQPFEAGRVVEALVDAGSFLELGQRHAREVVVGLARVEGMACGLVVNNPASRGGVFFPETCRKLTRFIRFMDRFDLPLVFLADAPGFMIGKQVEREGAVAAGAELFEAIAACEAPRLCVVLRRAYTAGLYAMGGSGFMPAGLFALPGASISVYGPEAVERFLAGLGLDQEREAELRRRIEEEHSLEAMRSRGLLDGVIAPEKLRREIARFLGGGR